MNVLVRTFIGSRFSLKSYSSALRKGVSQLAAAVIGVVLAASCAGEKDEVSLQKNTATPVIAESVRTEIRTLGFRDSAVVELKDYYLVEGDVLLPKSLFGAKSGRKDQYRANNIVDLNNNNISVVIDASMPTSGVDVWHHAIRRAVDHWNVVQGCRINLGVTGNATGNIVVRNDNGQLPNGTIAAAAYPANGTAGTEILVNVDFNANMTVSDGTKIYNIVHELGHCIGFRHSNWQARGESINPEGAVLIAGTLTSDANSVMNGGTALNTWAGFSTGDRTAAQTLYPTAPACTFNPIIEGPTVVTNSYPGGTAYFTGYPGPSAAGAYYEWQLDGVDIGIDAQLADVGVWNLSPGNHTVRVRLINDECASNWGAFTFQKQ